MSKIVADVMSRDPQTVRPETPLQEAIQILANNRISGLPVVDELRKLVGVLSETDLMWQEMGATPPAYVMLLDSVIYLKNPVRYEKELHKALGQTVGELMTPDVITVGPDSTLSEAARLMYEKQVRRLPVIDESRRVVGILTRGDIIREMAAGRHES